MCKANGNAKNTDIVYHFAGDYYCAECATTELFAPKDRAYMAKWKKEGYDVGRFTLQDAVSLEDGQWITCFATNQDMQDPWMHS